MLIFGDHTIYLLMITKCIFSHLWMTTLYLLGFIWFNTKVILLLCWKCFFSLIENQFRTTIKRFRSDNGGEFFNNQLKSFFEMKGAVHQSSCPHTPQQNILVERKHKHLLEIARALKIQADFPNEFWSYCIVTAAYLINFIPSAILNGKTPFEILHGKPPSISHLRVFALQKILLTVIRWS